MSLNTLITLNDESFCALASRLYTKTLFKLKAFWTASPNALLTL